MKTLFIIVGTVSLVLGVIGIVVPLLPTTPFLLLSAALYMHSSQRLYSWLISSKYLGGYIRRYNEERRIPQRMKIYILTILWGSLLYSIFYIVADVCWARGLLVIVGVGVTWHILSLNGNNKNI